MGFNEFCGIFLCVFPVFLPPFLFAYIDYVEMFGGRFAYQKLQKLLCKSHERGQGVGEEREEIERE